MPVMQFPSVKGLTSHQYTVAIRLTPHQSLSTELQLHQQSARTCGSSTAKFLSSKLELVNWNEVFFFKVDSPVCRFFFFFTSWHVLLKDVFLNFAAFLWVVTFFITWAVIIIRKEYHWSHSTFLFSFLMFASGKISTLTFSKIIQTPLLHN